jgi:hypothetical protein
MMMVFTGAGFSVVNAQKERRKNAQGTRKIILFSISD